MDLAKAANLAPLVNLVSRYVLFDLETKTFVVPSKREQGIAPRERSLHLMYEKSAVNNEAGVGTEVWDSPKQLEAVFRFCIYLYLHHSALPMYTNAIYTIQECWTEYAQYALKTNKLPDKFHSLRSFAAIAPDVASHFFSKMVIDMETVAPEISNSDDMAA